MRVGINFSICYHLRAVYSDVIKIEIVSALLALCDGNPSVSGGFPSQRPSKADLNVFFDVSLCKPLNKQSSRRWFETPRCSLWRHCNVHHYERIRIPVSFLYRCVHNCLLRVSCQAQIDWLTVWNLLRLFFTVEGRQGRIWQESGPRLNIKTVLSAYGVFHVKDKTAVRTSYL